MRVVNTPASEFVMHNPTMLRYRATWYDLLTPDVVWPEVDDDNLITGAKVLFENRLVAAKGKTKPGDQLYRIVSVISEDDRQVTIEPVSGVVIPTSGEPLLDSGTYMKLSPGIPENNDRERITVFGTYFLNYYLYADVFGTKMPYVNDIWEKDSTNSRMVRAILEMKVDPEDVDKYANRIYPVGQSAELSAPSVTRASLTVGHRLAKLRASLLEEHGAKLKAGDLSTMVAVEDAMKKAIKDDLRGDPSMGFMLSDKNIDQLLRMTGMSGIVGSLTRPGEYTYVTRSLMDDRDVNDLSAVSNEIRGASINRALETAKGGEDSKFIIRVLQNLRITMPDCGSREYKDITFNKFTRAAYEYRTALVGGKEVVLTADVMKTIPDGTVVQLRSPIFCRCKDGYCYACTSDIFKRLGKKIVTMSSLSLTSFFLRQKLKALHGTSRANVPIAWSNYRVIAPKMRARK